MSEIKGQLLGIILTIVVFGGISVVLANVFNNTSNKVVRYTENIEAGAADEVNYVPPSYGAEPAPSGLLHY